MRRLQKPNAPLAFFIGLSPLKSGFDQIGEAMPPNLSSLSISDNLCLTEEWNWTEEDLLAIFGSWIPRWRECTPRLSLIALDFIDTYEEELSTEAREEIEQMGAEARIRV